MARHKEKDKEFAAQFDRLPEEERILSKVTDSVKRIAGFYGFEKISTPVLEDPRAFSGVLKSGLLDERSPLVCRTTAVGDFMVRPTGVLGIFRAYNAHKMNDLPHPLKFIFEGESYCVQTRSGGQLRNVRELGLCMVGEEGAIAEAEIIQVLWKSLETLGVSGDSLGVRINANTCIECRSGFRGPFVSYFRPRVNRLCKNCKRHLKSNVFRVLSCREEQCRAFAQNAPQVLDHICEVCKRHLREVLEFMDEIRVPYSLDHRFFRESFLFNMLVFELNFSAKTPKEEKEENGSVEDKAPEVKGEITLADGGRMSKAGELVVGRKLDVACAIVRVEAVAQMLKKNYPATVAESPPKVYLAQLGELAKKKSLGLLEILRAGDISVQESLGRDSIKSQLKVAEKSGAEMALILGQKEAIDRTIIVREVSFGTQETVSQEKLIEFLKRKLKK